MTAASSSQGGSHAGPRILLVEDNDEDAFLIERQLRKGLAASCCRVSSKEAYLQALASPGADVILCDYQLLGFTGIEAFAAARERKPEVPFILVSGYIGEEAVSAALKEGVTDVVLKDRLERLGPAIARALEGVAAGQARQNAELARARSEYHLRQLVEHVPAAVALFDGELRYLMANPRWIADFKLPPDLVGRSIYDAVPALPERYRKAHRLALAGTPSGMEEDRYCMPDGSALWIRWAIRPWFEPDGRVGGIVIFSEDITARKQAQEALRSSEERLRLLVESVREHSLLMLDPKGRILTWNPGAERMFGWTAQEVVGRSLRVTYPRGGGQRLQRALATAKEQARAYEEGERIRKDGSRFRSRAVTAAIRDTDGRLLGFARVSENMEAELRAREAFRRTVELEEANRRSMDSVRLKSQLISTLSHELRNPLQAMLGFCTLLMKGKLGPLAPAQKEALVDILAAGRHVHDLLQGLLDRAKIEAASERLRMERVDLGAVVDQVKDGFELIASEKDVRLFSRVAPGLQDVIADATKVRQVLYNYLSNAIKASPRGGDVRIRVRPERNGRFRIEVADQGPGIPAKDRRRLFQDFEQLGSGGEGAGLGLAVTKRIVEAHGGFVGCRRARPRGSIFYAVLPARPPGNKGVVK
ncbi:MAG TPA: PAS domain S-box protein [Planctomycetota bacterium]|nr:PAS domain S-box protein [Planctomycetota bacterium]